jgi:hypothetical protein
VINKSFFLEDLEGHLAKLYDKNRYYNKIEKVKNKCSEVKSLQDLKDLVDQQYTGFFQKPPKINPNNSNEMNNEQSVGDQENQVQDQAKLKQQEEEFGNILKKHSRRL